MAKKVTRGTFITFEGPEGCGKSTQSRLLASYLRRLGYAVVYVREPGGTVISEKIRQLLLDARNEGMSGPCEMFLYMAARAQIVNEVILPALKRGKTVICDRFLDSTLAYQGYGLGMDIRQIRFIGKVATSGLQPDLTVLLDLPVKHGLRHRISAQDRIEKRPFSFHLRVRRGYLALAAIHPQRIRMVGVKKDKYATHQEVKKLVSAFLKRKGNLVKRKAGF